MLTGVCDGPLTQWLIVQEQDKKRARSDALLSHADPQAQGSQIGRVDRWPVWSQIAGHSQHRCLQIHADAHQLPQYGSIVIRDLGLTDHSKSVADGLVRGAHPGPVTDVELHHVGPAGGDPGLHPQAVFGVRVALTLAARPSTAQCSVRYFSSTVSGRRPRAGTSMPWAMAHARTSLGLWAPVLMR